MNEPWAIELEDVTVAYREQPVLWHVDLQIPTGKLMAIIGPNGAGKSTLLKAILGIVRPIAGSVRVFGRAYRQVAKRVAYIPQRSSVDWDFPTTVRDVVLMGTYGQLGWFRRPGPTQHQLANAALDRMGMTEFAHRQISQLSGGQQQRVFIARALVQQADLYLMDEPLQGVDATTEETIITLLKELQQQGKTIVVVHHDLSTVEQIYDWVTCINIERIASGPTTTTFTPDVINHTYRRVMTLSPHG
jgi:manganese/zinc/iron transport system ATP- binding protein